MNILSAAAALVSVTTFYSNRYSKIKSQKKASLITKLKNTDLLTYYHRLLERSLNFLSDRFGSSFSMGSNNFTTNLAVFYSYAVFFLIWVLSGIGDLGNIAILNSKIDSNYRLGFFLISLVIMYISFIIHDESIKSYYKKTKTRALITKIIVYIPYGLVALLLPLQWTKIYILSDVQETLIIILFSSSLGGLILNRAFLNSTGAVTFAVTFISLVFGSGTFYCFIYYSSQPIFGILTLVSGSTFAFFVYGIIKKFGAGYVYGLNVIMVALLIILIRTLPGKFNIDQTAIILLYFFVLLPSINGLMDWISLGISRKFGYAILKLNETAKIASYVLFDLIIACILLGLMTFIFIFGTKLFNLFTYQEYLQIPIDQLIKSTIENPRSGNGIWVISMLVSTLIPTGFHLFFAINALLNKYSSNLRALLISKLNQRRVPQIDYHYVAVYIILKPIIGLCLTGIMTIYMIGLVLPLFNRYIQLVADYSTKLF